MERIGGEKSVILHTMSAVSGRCLANYRRTRDVATARAHAIFVPIRSLLARQRQR